LIRHFVAEKRHIYFLATQESDLENRRTFQRQTAKALSLPHLDKASDLDWEFLFAEAVRAAHSTRLIIVIDEFQYLGLVNAAFPSILQRLWDQQLAQANIMLIVCGSLLSLMESQVLKPPHNGP